ncbi:hypothetical protein [Mucilaginibacter terrae]|uniref:CHAT domain-containing protein n=1 Tax=Mucilaginibacter terrae TaxID=1955052 RepID=A0ABU3GR82_9SPHI|nr:hypothetical protein [Mucilaginibacter terrae]MDT3402293.1 hypothetical protein [Mucilaginibacter terrae]
MISTNTLYTITKIQYVILLKNVPNTYPAANFVLEYTIIPKLRYFPIDLLQFIDGYDYFAHVKERDSGGLQVLFFSIDDVLKSNSTKASLEAFKMLGRVVIFLFSYECLPRIYELLNVVNRIKLSHWYFSIQAADNLVDVNGHPRYFMNADGLFALLHRDSKKLANYISSKVKHMKNLRLNVPKVKFVNTEYVHFRPIVSNVLNIFRADNILNIETHYNWEDAPLENRQKLLLTSLRDLDDIHLAWGEELGISSFRSLPTLIMIFPFHNPLFREAVSQDKRQLFTKVLLAEQTKDYQHHVRLDEGDDPEAVKAASRALSSVQSDVFDGIAYLHASFQFSPVLRFPIQSSELNKELSLLSMGKSKGLRRSANRYKLILRLGSKFHNVFLEPDLEAYISERNGQILVVSDLPIEWMLIKGVPLGFLGDVCRIQDSNVQGFLLNYSIASKIRFQLGEKAVEKALVLFSSNETDKDDFEKSIALVEFYGKELHFNIGHAGSIQEVKSLIEKYKPQILIFDCHCEFDKETLRCYLQIGDDRMYSNDIVKYGIAAPIVYLCCCNTNPNYDNLDKLHDAFVAAGAITVTGTFLPLDMERGTFVYVRMLSLLRSKQERLASGNWLHFVSFCIRTSLIWEARGKCWVKFNRALTDEEEAVFIRLLEKLHSFEHRAEVFNTFVNEGLRISDELILKLEDTNLEFMYYSHYGRPDLIKFTG